jgi:hypothetical protein
VSGPHRLVPSTRHVSLAHASSHIFEPKGDPLVLRIRVSGLKSFECVIGGVGMVEEAAAITQVRLSNSESSSIINAISRPAASVPLIPAF